MTEDEYKSATVWFSKVGGQGVLIPGGMILTAAHCIEWAGDGRMVVGEDIVEEIETKDGRKLRCMATMVDPVADIAVMCSLDDQSFYDAARDYQSFCDETAPAMVSTRQDAVFEQFPIRVLSHKGDWIAGVAKFCNPNRRSVWIETTQPIEGGTSGGPVIDESGALLGVVSHASETDPPRAVCDGSIAYASRSLPAWLLEELRN